MCVGMNGDEVPPGERCASTTNRNFKGRQGKRQPHPSHVARNGRRGGRDGPPHRCAPLSCRDGGHEAVRQRLMRRPVRLDWSTSIPISLFRRASCRRRVRKAMAAFCLHDLRRDASGALKPDFPLERSVVTPMPASLSRARISVAARRARRRSMCWSTAACRCVIAPSFGDIFASNAIKNGLLAGDCSRKRMLESLLDRARGPRTGGRSGSILPRRQSPRATSVFEFSIRTDWKKTSRQRMGRRRSHKVICEKH